MDFSLIGDVIVKKINILKKSEDFSNIIKSVKPIKYKYFIFYLKYEEVDYYKFGLSVGKKIGNAVTRNKVKRQLKNIIDKNNYKNSFKCIIIVSRDVLNHNYNEIEKDLQYILNKNNLIKENYNEKK